MTDFQRTRMPTIRSLLRKSRDMPLLAACTVPLSDAQVRILDELETLTAHWIARRRKAVKSNCDIMRALAATGYSDPYETTACMMQVSAGSASRFVEDLREGSELWMKCWLDLANGMTMAGLVSAKTAEVVAPIQTGNHSTPL